jgi:cyclopropane fatty-acyl-phospholipid synthase-like methyltransferase
MALTYFNKHYLHTLILDGKLHLAPVGEHSPVRALNHSASRLWLIAEQKVLDLGTVAGIWAIDFTNQYPSATIIGIDISPTQPSWVPLNVRFEIEDFTDDWTFKPNEFDYIHIGCLYVYVNDWPKFYRQVYRYITPCPSLVTKGRRLTVLGILSRESGWSNWKFQLCFDQMMFQLCLTVPWQDLGR